MWVIHIELKYFCWEEDFSLNNRKENVDDWRDFYGKIKLANY